MWTAPARATPPCQAQRPNGVCCMAGAGPGLQDRWGALRSVARWNRPCLSASGLLCPFRPRPATYRSHGWAPRANCRRLHSPNGGCCMAGAGPGLQNRWGALRGVARWVRLPWPAATSVHPSASSTGRGVARVRAARALRGRGASAASVSPRTPARTEHRPMADCDRRVDSRWEYHINR